VSRAVRIPYLVPLSPRPWSQTMVALCVPLGLTTCVLPYSNGLLAPACIQSNAHSFVDTYHLTLIPHPAGGVNQKPRTKAYRARGSCCRRSSSREQSPRLHAPCSSSSSSSSPQGPPTLLQSQRQRRLSVRVPGSGGNR
jgi:hypothetical protein